MFITFEGIDGSGKSTQSRMLYDRLKRMGYRVHLTREPGGTKVGDTVRNFLLYSDDAEMHYRTKALLFSVSFAQQIEEVVKPLLDDGYIVICDRFYDSTIAYQLLGMLDSTPGTVELLNMQKMLDYAIDYITPDITFLLEVDSQTAIDRLSKRKDNNKIDNNSIEFFDRVSEGYLYRALNNPHRIKIFKGNIPVKRLHKDIFSCIEHILHAYKRLSDYERRKHYP